MHDASIPTVWWSFSKFLLLWKMHTSDRPVDLFYSRTDPRINIHLGNKKGRRITAPFWGWRGEKRVRSTRRHPERRKPSRRVRRNPPGRSPPCRKTGACAGLFRTELTCPPDRVHSARRRLSGPDR